VYRETEQRRHILQELRACSDHPSADQLFGRLRKRLPRISLATVYRNLELLVAQGKIQRLDPGPKRGRYDGVATPHPHFRCIACGKIEDVENAPGAPTLGTGRGWLGSRRLLGSRIEYFGLCLKCATKV